MASLLPLAFVSQQPYVSELLSFTLECLHKNRSFFELMRRGFRGKCKKWRLVITALSLLLRMRWLQSKRNCLLSISILNLWVLALQITEIPNLTSSCTEFIESAELILEERKMN